MRSKRRRTAVEEAKSWDGHVRLVDEELRQLMGGQKLLLESELTKADLLQFLKMKGFIREVKGIVDVMVQTMNGDSFGVALEEEGTVADLKSEIQEAQGAVLFRQQLFMLGEGMEGGIEVQKPLSENHEIGVSCTVMLCVQAEEEWSWDASSPLLERNVFELRGSNNSVAAKIDQDWNDKNCMMAGRVMKSGTGKHTISMHLSEECTHHGLLFCGVVSDEAACDKRHATPMSTAGWFLDSCTGCLWGNGKGENNRAGRIERGAVLTMQVDTDVDTLKFWVNGKPHGPGFTRGARGRLRWATAMRQVGSTVTIVPTPAALRHF